MTSFAPQAPRKNQRLVCTRRPDGLSCRPARTCPLCGGSLARRLGTNKGNITRSADVDFQRILQTMSAAVLEVGSACNALIVPTDVSSAVRHHGADLLTR